MMKKMRKDRKADVGIGTMIVFIAAILVSAVAASVLIQTANQVREQAQSTGDQAIRSIATGMQVIEVVGQSNVAGTSIGALKLFVRLNAGSEPIRLDTLAITLTGGTTSTVLSYSALGPDALSFSALVVKDVSGLFSTNKAMGQGDLVQIDIGLIGGDEIDLRPSQILSVKLMPSMGMPTSLRLTAPECIYSTYTSLG
jgi:flagellin FlaB